MPKKGKYCFNDPNVRCKEYINTNCVNYTGANLPYIEVTTGETLTEILQGLNDLFSDGITSVDEQVKVSANDSLSGYLIDKLVEGTGISFTENNDGFIETLEIINSAPDQVVTLTEGNGIDISGTYPDFTITHEDTSSVSNLDTTGAQVIDTLTFDTFGHVQTVTTRDLTLADLGYTPPDPVRFGVSGEDDTAGEARSFDTATNSFNISGDGDITFVKTDGATYQNAIGIGAGITQIIATELTSTLSSNLALYPTGTATLESYDPVNTDITTLTTTPTTAELKVLTGVETHRILIDPTNFSPNGIFIDADNGLGTVSQYRQTAGGWELTGEIFRVFNNAFTDNGLEVNFVANTFSLGPLLDSHIIVNSSLQTLSWVEGSLAGASNGYVWTLVNNTTGEGAWQQLISGGNLVDGEYRFDSSTTAADPGTGDVRLNNATYASVTEIYISQTSNLGFDAGNILGTLQEGDIVYIQQQNDATKWFRADINATPTDNGSWWTIPVNFVNSGGILFTNNALLSVIVSLNNSSSTINSGVTGKPAYYIGPTTLDDFTPIDYATSGTLVTLTHQNTTDVGMLFQGISSQTADFLQFKNNGGTILAHVNESGYAGFGRLGVGLSAGTDPTIPLHVTTSSSYGPGTYSALFQSTSGIYNTVSIDSGFGAFLGFNGGDVNYRYWFIGTDGNSGSGFSIASGTGGQALRMQNHANGTNNVYTLLGSTSTHSITPARKLEIAEENSTTNAVTYITRNRIESSGTPATGIGIGSEWMVETGVSNFEIGGVEEFVTTDVTGGSEDFDYVLKLMAGGAAAAEKIRVLSTGELKVQLLNQDDTEDKIVVWNSTDKILEYRDVATISGSGSGTVNTGAALKAAYYPSAGTTVDDFAGVDYATSGNNVTITQQNTTDVALRITAAASSAEDLLRIVNNGGTNMLQFSENSELIIGNISDAGQYSVQTVNGYYADAIGISQSLLKGVVSGAPTVTFGIGNNSGTQWDISTTNAPMNLQALGSAKHLYISTEQSNSYVRVRPAFSIMANFSTSGLTVGQDGVAARTFQILKTDAVTNAVTYLERQTYQSSGTVANGFGLGTEYELENASGTNRIVGTEEYVYTNAGNTTEAADKITKLIRAGTLTEGFRVISTGQLKAAAYGSGTFTGTATKWLAVTNTGLIIEEDPPAAGYTNLTQFVGQTAWRVFYSDGSGDVQELALGSSGQYLKSNGATSVPSWDTPSGTGEVYATITIGAFDALTATGYDYVCDGTADDVQILAAIAALPATGGRIILSEGTFNIAAAIVIDNDNVTLEGQGQGTKIFLSNATNTNVITVGNGATAYTNITVKNLTIDGNKANQTTAGHGIFISAGAARTIIENCRIEATFNHNISDNGSDGARILNCYLNTPGTSSDNIDFSGINATIQGNTCLAARSASIRTDSSTHASGVQIIGNVCIPGISSGATGIILGSWQPVCVGNTISNFGVYGINSTSPAEISGNVIHQNLSTANGGGATGIRIASSDPQLCTGNTIFTYASVNYVFTGILIDGADSSTVTGNNMQFESASSPNHIGIDIRAGLCTISGNTITQYQQTGTAIVSSNSVEKCTISNNLVTGFATGIDVTGSRYFTLSGNTINCNAGIVGTDAWSLVINGNSMFGSPGTGVGINLQNTTLRRVTIVGNSIVDFDTTAMSLVKINHSTISGNSIYNCGNTQVILIDGGSTYNTFTGNNIGRTSGTNTYGIREDSSLDGPNTYVGNVVLGATTPISVQHASSQLGLNITS